MSDDDFDELDFDDEPGSRMSQVLDDSAILEDIENRGAVADKRFSSQMTQKLYGTDWKAKGNNRSRCTDNYRFLDPRNEFEKFLKEERVQIAYDDELETHTIVFGESLNHEEFAKSIEKKMMKNRGSNPIFDEFSASCKDKDQFALYLSPAQSSFGVQDTIVRAFLMAKPSQTKTFELLLESLNQLARRTDENDIILAQTCVAHMRHLGRIFEPQPIFNMVFEHHYHKWNPNVRNGLITAFPEIFPSSSHQQDAALRLADIMEEKEDIQDLESFQMTIVNTLKLLRMEATIRRRLVHLCMQFDSSTLPFIVSFALGTLLIPSNSKNDEEEMIFHELLLDFAKFLKIDQVKRGSSRNSNADNIIFEIYDHFLRYLQLDRKAWKYVTSYVNRNRKEQQSVKEENENDEEGEEEAVVVDKNDWINSFEVMLIFSVMSSECCPPTLITAVNSRILGLPSSAASASSKFLKLIDLVIGFKKFSTTHLGSIIHVARQCLWSVDIAVRQFGTNIYKQLLIGMENNHRSRVFTELMKHFTQGDTECESVLEVIFKVLKSHSNVIMEFSQEIETCIESIHKLSISNVKRLFQVMLLMSGNKNAENKFEIDDIIDVFLNSTIDRERFLGILALIMKIQYFMSKKHSEAQEEEIQKCIERLEETMVNSPILRAAFYEHFATVVEGHKRNEEIRFLITWSDELMKKFKFDFFVEPEDESMEEEAQNRLILKPKAENFIEVAPMFNLIKELLVVRMRWKEEDDDSLRSSYDVSAIKDLNFAFEAVVSLANVDNSEDKEEKLNQLYFTIQWCRTVLNAFLSQSSVDFLSSDVVSNCGTTMFYLMMDCEKKLLGVLGGVRQWPIPNLKFELKKDIIVVSTGSSSDKSGTTSGRRKAKKRKSDETMAENVEDVEGEDDASKNEREKEKNPNLVIQLRSHYVQMKLRPIVHLIHLCKSKRSCLIYLCEELQQVLQDLSKMRSKKSNLPMLASRPAPKTVDKLYHGDSVTIWYCVKKAVDEIWSIVEHVFEYFSGLAESSQSVNMKLYKDLEDLGQWSMLLMHTILSSEFYGCEEKLSNAERSEKKSVLIMIIEKQILKLERLSNDSDKARIEVGKYLVANAEFAPTPDIAVAFLNVFETLKLDDNDLKKKMARYALAYLKKDWSTVDENMVKGAKYNTAVKDILRHYISLRKEKDQILAIQWILTNKVVQLVPDDDKRKSCVLSQRSDDDLLEKDDEKAVFHCISKATFGNVFKTIFSMLNSCVSRKNLSGNAVKHGNVTDEETLTHWENASSCFLILCLLLRVNKIRTVMVLSTAIKEGKQFLITVSRKSSFIHLIDNITKGTNFDVVSKKIERILSAVQQGNRVLQSIGTYAKTNKCVHLLKKYPELRAESENCLRIIHSSMVKNQCLDAFTVGLLKSRSIDGEIITENRGMSSDESDAD